VRVYRRSESQKSQKEKNRAQKLTKIDQNRQKLTKIVKTGTVKQAKLNDRPKECAEDCKARFVVHQGSGSGSVNSMAHRGKPHRLLDFLASGWHPTTNQQLLLRMG
jgi:hypothetical protein